MHTSTLVSMFFALLASLALTGSPAQASSYLRIGGTMDAIMHTSGALHSYGGPDLYHGVALYGLFLRGSQLSSGDLSGSDLRGSDLSDSDLAGADLSNSILLGSNFSGANLAYADLEGAVLSGVNFARANLYGANLGGAKLLGADLDSANLSGSDLSAATYLQTISGAVTYDIHTNFSNAWANEGTVAFDPVSAGWVLVPEPSTVVLLGLGLCLGSRTHRRR